MPAPHGGSYWSATKAPRYSLLLVFPLLVLYELLAFVLSHDAITGVRNGADVLLKSVFIALGGRNGILVFGVILVGTGLVLVWRDLRRSGGDVRPAWLGGMMAESILYALLFGLVASSLTSLLLHGRLWFLLQAPLQRMDLPTQLMVSLGAGIYEELLFRVILVGALFKAGQLLGWKPLTAGAVATVAGALIFSAFHYIGPYGDRLELTSFVFRAIAGVLFSGLYLLRGLGITAWTHALYDVFLSLR